MRDLEAELSMTQTSIYNAFGSKQALLNLAIDRYERRIDEELFSILLGSDDGLDGIAAFFEALQGWLERTGGRGCLVVNLMTGEIDDEAVHTRVRVYREKIRDAFGLALAKNFDDSTVVEGRASLLLTSVIGLHLAARTAAAGEIEKCTQGICAQVLQWRREQR